MVQGTTTAAMIDSIPNLNQNPLYFATLQAGIMTPRGSLFNSSTGGKSFGIGFASRQALSTISINGGETLAADIQLDGVPIMGSDYNDAAVLPNAEGIQEVRVLVNNFTAENGRGQGVASIVTKSGTNEFHGSANFRLRNEALNANGFTANEQGQSRQPFKAQYWGASLGGAIKKDKLFFFTSYEGLAHSNSDFWRITVPTALEKKGDFSQTFVSDENGNPVHAQVYDPFNVTQVGPNAYRRALVPGAILPAASINPHGQNLFNYYPDPTSDGIDAYHNNNYYKAGKQTFARTSVNSRVDYRLGSKHSIYGAGGIMAGTINGPVPYGADNPFWTYGNSWNSQNDRDHNPYASIGDTIVLNPTTVVDVRLGMTRIVTDSGSLDHSGLDYDSFGIPAAVQAIMPSRTQAPDVYVNGNFYPLGNTAWGHKKQRQLTESLTGSLTKNLGRWTFKAGGDYRVSHANYEDFAQGSIEIDAANVGQEYIDAVGNSISLDQYAVQNGMGSAALLQGAGYFSLYGGFGVRPAFTAKYGALFTQNDWRVNSKLTLNFGLRWELQPGPTERYNRISSFDDSIASPFGTGRGAIAFPGTSGYSRNLWNTHYNDFGPRLGFAYSLTQSTVLRGGYGITYTPTNTGFAPGPSRYGESPFTAQAGQGNLYGVENQNGVPIGQYDTGLTTQIIPQIGAQPDNPQIYGAGSGGGGAYFPIFNRNHYDDGRIQQYNLVLEKRLKSNWFVSLTLTGTKGDHLPDGQIPLASNQYIPASTLDNWRSAFIASNGQNPGQDIVQNPLQPASGALLPFNGALGQRTISQSLAADPNMLFTVFTQSRARGQSSYHAAVLQVSHAFANGFQLDAHYTYSKAMANYASDMFTNGGSDAGLDTLASSGKDLLNINNNWHLAAVDTPHRLVATYAYSLPFGKGGTFDLKNQFGRLVAGGWKIGGVTVIQSGMPINITGMIGSGSLNGRPDRVAGVPIELPKALQHIYDGKTQVTLPSGRVITPGAHIYLKYNPDAFSGRLVTLANGTKVADPYWWGNAALDYDDIRSPGRVNTDLNLSRSFNITEKKVLQFVANASNVFNQTEFLPNGSLNVGSVLTTGEYAGAINNINQVGGHGLATYEPRQIELKLRFTF